MKRRVKNGDENPASTMEGKELEEARDVSGTQDVGG
jgi:hypothetical protein